MADVMVAGVERQMTPLELALVYEDETVVGLLTATDALEAVMGEIEDPLDVRASE